MGTPTPMEIRFDEDRKTGNIMWAAIFEKPFAIVGDPKPELVNYTRKKHGGYEAEGSFDFTTTQLTIINRMIDSLQYFDDGQVALKVKDENGKVVKELSCKDTIGYLEDIKKLHQAKEHALKEMKELITYASQNDGKIDSDDNARLDEFAKQHGFKLFYRVKRDDLARKVVKECNLKKEEVAQWDDAQLVQFSKDNNVKFPYQDIRNNDEVRIQDQDSNNVIVKGLNITSLNKTVIGY